MSGKMLQVLISSIPALTVFLQFYTMLGSNTFIKNMLLLFPKKKSILREIGNLGTNLVQK